MIETHRDAFVAFCRTLTCEETVSTQLNMLMRQMVGSIAAVARTDGPSDRTGLLLGLQRSARRFVQAYVRSRTRQNMPECVDRIMNASSNADFILAFAKSVVPVISALPASIRASTIPPPQP